MKPLLITAGVIVLLLIGMTSFYVGTSNDEIRLRERISGQQEMTEVFYTKLWEVLKSKAGVADQYASKFKEIQLGIMEGRYSTGDKMMMWIQESNPEFDSSMYKDLMNSIEGERNGFFIEQKKLRDMSVQHSTMLKIFPSSIILGGRDEIKVTLLKNVATKKAFETGTDSSPDLFS